MMALYSSKSLNIALMRIPDKIKRLNENYVFLLALIPILLLQHRYINEFPSHIHAWAQSDHYALAIGFTNNGLNFFKPETLIYNHQLPNDWKTQDKTSITPVDFPINNYISALLMKLFNNRSPSVYRLYILLYSIIGLFFLFRIGFLFSKSSWLSLLLVLFATTSPVYAYYQAGFLPSIPAVSNVFIGYYYYLLWVKQKKIRFLTIAISFTTLAALIRTPFNIYLIAIFCAEILSMLKSKKFNLKITGLFTLAFAIVAGYFLYNLYLYETYGSIFLNKPRPPQSLVQAKQFLSQIFNAWRYSYFSKVQYWVFLAAVSLFVVTIYKRRSLTTLQKKLLLILIISLFGSLLYAALMLIQFTTHDYYFLDTFYLPAIFLVTVLISSVEKLPLHWKTTSIILLFFTSFFMIKAANSSQIKRRIVHAGEREAVSINAYQGSDTFLNSLGISRKDTIMAMYPVAPNIPFLLMNRKGYAIQNTTGEIIKDALTWDFNYITVANNFLVSDITNEYPDFIKRVKKIGSSQKLSVYQLLKSWNSAVTLKKFLGLDTLAPIIEESINFDTTSSPAWKNTEHTDSIYFSAPNSGLVGRTQKYGLDLKYTNLDNSVNDPRYVFITAKVHAKENNESKIVISITRNGKSLIFKPYKVKLFLRKPDQWNDVTIFYYLPSMAYKNTQISIFIWNPGRDKMFYDDFKATVY